MSYRWARGEAFSLTEGLPSVAINPGQQFAAARVVLALSAEVGAPRFELDSEDAHRLADVLRAMAKACERHDATVARWEREKRREDERVQRRRAR